MFFPGWFVCSSFRILIYSFRLICFLFDDWIIFSFFLSCFVLSSWLLCSSFRLIALFFFFPNDCFALLSLALYVLLSDWLSCYSFFLAEMSFLEFPDLFFLVRPISYIFALIEMHSYKGNILRMSLYYVFLKSIYRIKFSLVKCVLKQRKALVKSRFLNSKTSSWAGFMNWENGRKQKKQITRTQSKHTAWKKESLIHLTHYSIWNCDN